MAEQFYTILTNTGKAKIANSLPTGQKVNLTKMKIGDSNGTYYNPSENQTELVHKVYECNVTSVEVDEINPSWITITAAIPSDVGGFSIREVGIFDDSNSLIAIGKYPETYKPVASDGSTKELYIKMTLEVTNAASVELKIDPTVILATKKDISNLDTKIEQNSSQLNDIMNNITNEINIKMFGAIGDGIIDDTKALNDAFNYVFQNGGKLVSDSNKVYCTTTGININTTKGVKSTIDFKGSAIKLTKNSTYGFKIDGSDMDYFEKVKGVRIKIKDMEIDVSKFAETAMYFKNLEGIRCESIILNNISKIGLHTEKTTSNFDKLSVNGDDSITTIGMKINSGDSRFNDVSLNRVHIGIYSIYGACNMYSNLHAWCGDNFKGSTFFINEGIGQLKSSTTCSMSNVYADSYQYTFWLRSKSPVNISNLIVYHNAELYTDDTAIPYVIYVDNTGNFLQNSWDYQEAQRMLVMSNSTIYAHKNIPTYYSNISKKFMKNSTENYYNELTDASQINCEELTLTEGNDYVLSNDYGAENKAYYRNGIVTVNIAISSERGFTSGENYTIAKINTWEFQSEKTVFDFACAKGDSSSEMIQLYLKSDDGTINVLLPSNISELKHKITGSLTFASRKSSLNS